LLLRRTGVACRRTCQHDENTTSWALAPAGARSGHRSPQARPASGRASAAPRSTAPRSSASGRPSTGSAGWPAT